MQGIPHSSTNSISMAYTLHILVVFFIIFLQLPILSNCAPAFTSASTSTTTTTTSNGGSSIIHPSLLKSLPTIGEISNKNKKINIPLISERAGKVEIASPQAQTLRIGHTSRYLFQVVNIDDSGSGSTVASGEMTYTFTASDTHNFITSVDTEEFALFPRESRNVSVTLSVPSSATSAENTTNILTVTVRSHSRPVRTTTKMVNSQIHRNRAPVVIALIENRPYWECTGENQGLAMLDGTESYDPDGDRVSYVWTNSTGDVLAEAQQGIVLGLGLGFHTLTLVGTDSFGASATDVADLFEVRDTEAPHAGAKFVKLGGGNGNNTHNNNNQREKDRYRVEWWCFDSCDPSPTVDVQINDIGQQIENGEVVELKLKRNIGQQTRWKRKPDGTLVVESRMFELRLVCRDAIGNEMVSVDYVRWGNTTCPLPGNKTNVTDSHG